MDKRFAERVLLRCFLWGLAFLILWGAMLLLGEATDHWTYDVHSAVFDITEHDFILMNYYGMNFLKVILVVGFLTPYLVVRFTGNSRKPAD
jgi:hypothetical protein